MKVLFLLLTIYFSVASLGQNAAEYGFKHLQTIYKGDTVDILIKSKKGEEEIKKPLFLFCQGSLPKPLIVQYDRNGKKGIYNVFVFNTDSLIEKYHLAIISKPCIPLIVHEKNLNNQKILVDSLDNPPKNYAKRNLLEYYVNRNLKVIDFLLKQTYISTKNLVVAGHSEGAAVAANIAFKSKRVTKLIYAAGSPLGRVMSVISRERNQQLKEKGMKLQYTFDNWDKTVKNKNDDDSDGDSHKQYYQMSNPPVIEKLLKIKIPVLVCYGTKDFGAVAQNDYLRIATIAKQKQNFTFNDYEGLEHNFFPLKNDDTIDYEIFNWDKVAEDWRKWIEKN